MDMDMDMLQLEAKNIVNHNYYAVLADFNTFSESNITPAWNDITTAPKTTPNNKAVSIDTKLISKPLNKSWNNYDFIYTNNTSVVVPVSKTAISTTPNNYSGISLISRLTKLIARLLSIKLNTLNSKYNTLYKKQTSFRAKKKIGFIDFKKAYDCVPHLSDAANYKRRVRQECLAPQIMFDIYVNNIFNGITGVLVSKIDNKIPGILYADDAVIPSESADELQKLFDILIKWCKRWDMNVN
ncbi:hypothetical protein BB561_004348, partial [Smittium simulii]